MSKSIIEVPATKQVTVTCDRCGKTDTRAVAADLVTPTDLPAGWIEAHHPEAEVMLTFDKRACTSVWFAAWVRRQYDVPEPGPRRRRSQTVSMDDNELLGGATALAPTVMATVEEADLVEV